MKIPVIALTNTGVDTLPENLKYTIVCNTSSLNSVQLITDTLVEAYNQGFSKGLSQVTGEKKDQGEAKSEKQEKVTQS
jgi:ribosomal protein S2